MFSQRKNRLWQIAFLQEICLLLHSGCHLIVALNHALITQNNKQKAKLQKVLNRLQNGQPFSESLSGQKLFSQEIIDLIAAGERVNQIKESVQLSLKWLEKSDSWSHTTKKLLTYPAFLLIVCLTSVIFASSILIPHILNLKSTGIDLPLTTEFFVFLSSMTYLEWLSGVLLGVAFMFVIYYLNQQFWFNKRLLKFGLLGQLLLYQDCARFCHHMSSALSIRLNFPESIKQSSMLLKQPSMKFYSTRVYNAIIQGTPLSKALKLNPLMPSIVVEIISSARGFSNQEIGWQNLANQFELKNDRIVERIQPFVEPTLTLLVGLIVLLFVHAIILPLYQSNIS